MEEETIDVEVEDTRPKILVQYSGKAQIIRCVSKEWFQVDHKSATEIDGDASNGFEFKVQSTEAAFMGFSMWAVDCSERYNVELSQRFFDGRNEILFGTKVEMKQNIDFFAWNPKYTLKDSQASMLHRISSQLELAAFTNKIVGATSCNGQGYYNISQPGTGKTPVSIALAIKLQAKRVLVVALTSLLDQWNEEIEKFHRPGFNPGTIVINSGAKKEDRTEAIADFCNAERGWAIVGYATFRDHIDEFLSAKSDYDLVVFDESGVMRNENNAVAIAASKLIFHHSQYVENPIRALNVLHLNGTPVPNHGGELYNLFKQCRAQNALAQPREQFEEDFCDINEYFIPVGNGKRVKKTVKSGIKSVFKLAREYGGQYGGLPKDKSNEPIQNDIWVNCSMSDEETTNYRALEGGYSKTPGKTSMEEYVDSQERQRVSAALDEHRKEGLEASSLTAYLDLVNEASSRIGARLDDNEDESEESGDSESEHENGTDIISLTEAFETLQMDWDLLQVDLQIIIDKRKNLVTFLESVKNDLKDENGKYPDGMVLAEQPAIIAVQAKYAEYGANGTQIRVKQADIREKQQVIEEKRKEIRIAEQVKAQARANTLIRLRRAAAGGEHIVSEDGTRSLQLYPSAKFRWIVDFLESNPNDKTIVFCSLRSTITYLAKHLRDQGIEVAVLVGGNSSSQSEMLRRYKTITHDSEGKICNVILITCEKGVGLNLQVTKHVIFESKPYLQTLVEQNIARAVREFGLNDIVNVYHLMTTFQDGAPTVDHYVQAILDKKAKTGAIFGANHVKPLILHVAKTETESLEEMREKYSKLN